MGDLDGTTANETYYRSTAGPKATGGGHSSMMTSGYGVSKTMFKAY
jgi:hypothetical protein